MKSTFNLYQTVTDKIIKGLENKELFWRKPWTGGIEPQNFITKKPYKGLNRLLLSLSNKRCPYYLSFKQINDLKGQVLKGAKSELITYWNVFEKETGEKDENGQPITETRFYLKYYRVFNLEDTKGIDWESELEKHMNKRTKYEKLEECENIVSDYLQAEEIEVKHIEQKAYYVPDFDYINMPLQETFKSDEEYYSTLFHEVTHSTMKETRTKRIKNNEINYAKEELIAEMGNAFLCHMTGIEQATLENSQAYINSWLKALKSDEKYIIFASQQAQKAVDYITSKQKELITA